MDISEYDTQIRRIHRELGISPTHAALARMPRQVESTLLVSIGADIYGRERQLIPAAAAAWHALVAAAARNGVVLQLVSAFRSVDHQRDIFARKTADGLTVDDILAVNAAPGYSEHHTGRAVDITTPGCETLSEAFEKTPAFAWLIAHGPALGWVLSYPRGNTFGVIYEPWHWAYLR